MSLQQLQIDLDIKLAELSVARAMRGDYAAELIRIKGIQDRHCQGGVVVVDQSTGDVVKPVERPTTVEEAEKQIQEEIAATEQWVREVIQNPELQAYRNPDGTLKEVVTNDYRKIKLAKRNEEYKYALFTGITEAEFLHDRNCAVLDSQIKTITTLKQAAETKVRKLETEADNLRYKITLAELADKPDGKDDNVVIFDPADKPTEDEKKQEEEKEITFDDVNTGEDEIIFIPDDMNDGLNTGGGSGNPTDDQSGGPGLEAGRQLIKDLAEGNFNNPILLAGGGIILLIILLLIFFSDGNK